MGNKRGSGAKNRGKKVDAQKPKMASFREDAGENRALQVQNGASASALVKSGGAGKTQLSPALPGSGPNSGNAPVNEKPSTLPSRPPAQTKKSSIPPRNLRYPVNEEIHNTTDYLKIDIVEYKPVAKNNNNGSLASSPGSRKRNGKNILHSIILPIPPNIQDGNAVSYSDSRLNGLTAALAGGGVDVMQGLPQVLAGKMEGGDLKDKIVSRINQSGLTPGGVQDLITKQLAASAVGVFGGNLSLDQLQARQEGNIFNPNMELLFNGPTLRSFRFSFKMTPRSQDESIAVRDIINTFKRSMAPKTVKSGGSQNLFLKTPDIFEIRYMQGSQQHSFLHKFKQCFLENMSVNYTGEGTYATYGDGTPISLVMNLSFKELEPIYDIDYDEEFSGPFAPGKDPINQGVGF